MCCALPGLDFSSASMVVFVELPHEVSLVRQAEDRAHRKGQKSAVNVYFLCAKGTCDDRRWQYLNQSLAHLSQVHDGMEGEEGEGKPGGDGGDLEGRGGEGPTAAAGGGSSVAGGEADGSGKQGGMVGVAGAPVRPRGLAIDAVYDLDPKASKGFPWVQDGTEGGPGRLESRGEHREECGEGDLGGEVGRKERRDGEQGVEAVGDGGQQAKQPSGVVGAGIVGTVKQQRSFEEAAVCIDLTADSPVKPPGKKTEHLATATAAVAHTVVDRAELAVGAVTGDFVESASEMPVPAAGSVGNSTAAGLVVQQEASPAAAHVEPADGAAAAATTCTNMTATPAVATGGGSGGGGGAAAVAVADEEALQARPEPAALPSVCLRPSLGPGFATPAPVLAALATADWSRGLVVVPATESDTKRQLMAAADGYSSSDADSDVDDIKGGGSGYGGDGDRALIGGAAEGPPAVWYEVSAHTSRLHFHLAADGGRPMGLNLPIDLLLLNQSTALQDLAQAWEKHLQQQREMQGQQRHQQEGQRLLLQEVGHPQLQHQTQEQQQQQLGVGSEKEAMLGEDPQCREKEQGEQLGLQQQQGQGQGQLQSPPEDQAGAAAVEIGGGGGVVDVPASPCATMLTTIPPTPDSQDISRPMCDFYTHTMPSPQVVSVATDGSDVTAEVVELAAAEPAAVSAAADLIAIKAPPPPAAAAVVAGPAPQAAPAAAPAVVSGAATPAPPPAAAAAAAVIVIGAPALTPSGDGVRHSSQELVGSQGGGHSSFLLAALAAASSQHQQQEGYGSQGAAKPALFSLLVGGRSISGGLSPLVGARVAASSSDCAAAAPPADNGAPAAPPAAALAPVLAWGCKELQQGQGQHNRQQHGPWLKTVPPDTCEQPPAQQQQQEQQAQPEQEGVTIEPLQPPPEQQPKQLVLAHADTTTGLLTCRHAPGFIGPCGMVSIPLPLTSPQLLELLLEAEAFARDWAELRAITKNRLTGRILPPSCADAVDQAVTAAAAGGAGKVGSGTARYLQDRGEGDVPDGVRLVEVMVHYPRGRVQLVRYKQGFNVATGGRLCLHCFKAVPESSVAKDAVLEGGLDLFCCLECETSFYIKNSSGEAKLGE